MFKKTSFFGTIALAALIVTGAWADPSISPGQWEITSKTQMAGMPSQSVTSVQCIKLGDPFPELSAESQDCRVKNKRISGNTISWNIVCDGQGGKMNGTGRITYNGDTMKGTMVMSIESAGMEIKNIISGRRLGDCPN